MEQYVDGRQELKVTVARVFILRMTNLVALIISLRVRVSRVRKTNKASHKNHFC